MSVSETSVQLISSAEVRFDRLCSRVFQSHHCNRLERNTFRPSSVGWRGVVVFSFELHVSWFSEKNRMETLSVRGRVPNVLSTVGVALGVRFQFFRRAVGDRLMANMVDEQETCPCLCSYLFLLSEGKVSLFFGLPQLYANFWAKIVILPVGKRSKCI